MIYRPLLTSRSLIPVAVLLVAVIVAISPRALLAPALSFSQAQESKRPKTPKNIVRTTPSHTSAGERSGRSPRPGPASEAVRETQALLAPLAQAPRIPDRAFRELTKPDYLKLFSGSPPGNRLAPPA
jgi:hypothetical protein